VRKNAPPLWKWTLRDITSSTPFKGATASTIERGQMRGRSRAESRFTCGSRCEIVKSVDDGRLNCSFLKAMFLSYRAPSTVTTGTHKKAFVKKLSFPLQLFLPKLPPPRQTPVFWSFSAVCLAPPLPHIQKVRCMLHQAPIGIKALFVAPEHPFRTSGPEYCRYHAVSKSRYNAHGFSPPHSGSRHGQHAIDTSRYPGDGTVAPLNARGIGPTTCLVHRPPRILTRTVFSPRKGPDPS